MKRLIKQIHLCARCYQQLRTQTWNHLNTNIYITNEINFQSHQQLTEFKELSKANYWPEELLIN